MCSYQPDTLTVRASFSVPGKSGVAAVQPEWESNDRSARHRKFRLVDKSSLVLKSGAINDDEESPSSSSQESDAPNSVANIKEITTTMESFVDLLADQNDDQTEDQRKMSKYDRLINNNNQQDDEIRSTYLM